MGLMSSRGKQISDMKEDCKDCKEMDCNEMDCKEMDCNEMDCKTKQRITRIDMTRRNGEKIYLEDIDAAKWKDIVNNVVGLTSVHASGSKILTREDHETTENDVIYFKETYEDGTLFELTGDESVCYINRINEACMFQSMRRNKSMNWPEWRKA